MLRRQLAQFQVAECRFEILADVVCVAFVRARSNVRLGNLFELAVEELPDGLA